ncbi:MAG: lysophospholipid acyltransferase family protein [Deltaproteobacteria bacterium]|nr:lysophospholipid acyltransferase family protein [Deltaproteobacteria bacterium]
MRYTIFDTPALTTLMQRLSLFLLNILGWRIQGRVPDLPKFVIIGAPHTSNWDFPIMILFAFALKVKIFWMGKDALFRKPFGTFFKRLGGIPIDRSKSNRVVAQMVQIFQENEKLILVIPPEGTRKKVRFWKTGFYYIAKGADIPIVMGYMDYCLKVGGFGPMIRPTGDIESDMSEIKAFYADITGKYPDKSS